MEEHRERRWENYVGFWPVLFLAAGLMVLTFHLAARVRQALPSPDRPSSACPAYESPATRE